MGLRSSGLLYIIIYVLAIIKNGAGINQKQMPENIYYEYEAAIKAAPKRYDPARARLGQFMRSYYEDAKKRVAELNRQRFLVEESYEYEMGYIMHELYDKYKKQVEQYNKGEYNRTRSFRNLSYLRPDHLVPKSQMVFGFEKVERTEMSQKLYFDIYHLANMIHELHRKWGWEGPADEDWQGSQEKRDEEGHALHRPHPKYKPGDYQYDLEKERHKKIRERNRERKDRQRKNREKEKREREKNKDRAPGDHLDEKQNRKIIEEFIKERMKEQGWEAVRNRTRTPYPREYGWDVPVPDRNG